MTSTPQTKPNGTKANALPMSTKVPNAAAVSNPANAHSAAPTPALFGDALLSPTVALVPSVPSSAPTYPAKPLANDAVCTCFPATNKESKHKTEKKQEKEGQ
eukprot:PhF_6_TR20851/c2_g1_i2/m.30047